MSTTTNSESPSLSSIMIARDTLGAPSKWARYCTGGIWFKGHVETIIKANTWPSAIGPHLFSVHTIAFIRFYETRDGKMFPLNVEGYALDVGLNAATLADALVEWMHYCDAVVDAADEVVANAAADTATDLDLENEEAPAIALEAVRLAMTTTWATFPADAERVMALDATDTLETREAIDVALERLSLGDLDTVLTTARNLAAAAAA